MDEASVYDVRYPPTWSQSSEVKQNEDISIVEQKCSATVEKHNHQILIKK